MDINPLNQVTNIKYIQTQKDWGWQVAIYLYLAGMGAGSFVIGILMDWLGYSAYFPRAIFLWGPIMVAIGAPFLILKLGIKTRFWRACLNPRTSWLARGFLILMVFICIGIIVFGASLFTFDWLDSFLEIILALEVISFVFAFAVAIYTGILIQSVKYVPFWNTWFLPTLFTVSALSTGSMSIILSVLGYDFITSSQQLNHEVIEIVMHIEQVLILIEAIILTLYLYLRYQARDQGMNSVRLLLVGKLKPVFWGGIITSGFILPVILEFVYSSIPDYPVIMVLAGLFLLTGGYFIRAGTIYAGVKELHPLQNMFELDYIQDILEKKKETQLI